MNNAMDQTLSDGEAALVEVFRDLKETLLTHGDDLPPFARRNGLDMDAEQLYQLGA
jgi:hypothetical protein